MDWPGQITLAIGLFALVGSLLRAQQEGWGATITVAGLAVAAAALVAFVAIEARSSHPMVPLTLFRNRSFTGAQVGALAISASFFSVFLYSTIYLQQVLGLTAIEAGLVYIPGTIVNFVVAGATSQMGEKFSPRALVAGGLALVGVGQLLLTSVEVGSSWTATLPGTIVAMIGVGVFNATSTNLALSSAPPEQAGLAAGVHDTFRQAGIAVGVAALGALVPSGAGLIVSSPQAYVNGMTNALTVGGAVALVGAGATWLLIQGRRGEPAKTVVIEPRLVPQPA